MNKLRIHYYSNGVNAPAKKTVSIGKFVINHIDKSSIFSGTNRYNMFIQKQWLLSACFYFIFQTVSAQPNKSSKTDQEILKIYEAQLKEVYIARGMTGPEIAKYLAGGKAGISTLDDFAEELEKLFSIYNRSRMAILFFVFNKDTLFRFFITVGEIKEKKVIPITKKKLEQLNIDVYNALNIYKQAANRSPQERGLKPVSTNSTPVISFDKAIKNARAILLPQKFDERYEHLIVIPAFTIGAFPFHVLRPYKDSSYLIDKCSFSIAPSLLDLVAIRKRMLKNFGEQALWGKNVFTLDNPLFVSNPAYPRTGRFFFPDLPGAKKEIEGSIPLANKYILLEGPNATKINVLNNIRKCDVAYFATHGISSEVNPLDNNFLVLAGEENSFLTARDIMSLRDTSYSGAFSFPQMVILSACQTGLGKSMEAGITAGLTRAFLVSGANQVIMSLWNVDDDATAYLMNRFIYHLKNPNEFSPSEPLRLAQLDTRKKFPNPVHWASFSVFGVNY